MNLDVCVETGEMRKALVAVRVHADKTKTGGDGTTSLHRIRLSFGVRECAVMATNTATAAIAILPLVDEDGSPVDEISRAGDDGRVISTIIDIEPRHALRILGTFPVTKAERDGMTQILSISANEDGCDVEDISGLVAGDSIHLRAVGNGQGFPDLWSIVGAALKSADGSPHIKPLTSPGKHFSAFASASSAYDTPLTITPTGTKESRGFIVECGSQFVGTIESRHQDDDSLRKRDAARMRWLSRFSGRDLKAV